MGLFGGSKSSTTAQDNSVAVQEGALGLTTPGNENVINVTSPEGFALAEKAIEAVRSASLSVAQQASADAGKAVEALVATRQATVPFNVLAAVVVIAGLYFWSKA